MPFESVLTLFDGLSNIVMKSSINAKMASLLRQSAAKLSGPLEAQPAWRLLRKRGPVGPANLQLGNFGQSQPGNWGTRERGAIPTPAWGVRAMFLPPTAGRLLWSKLFLVLSELTWIVGLLNKTCQCHILCLLFSEALIRVRPPSRFFQRLGQPLFFHHLNRCFKLMFSGLFYNMN